MLETASDDCESARIKAELLCWGLHPNEATSEILSRQNPCYDQKTGNFGIHIAFPNGSHTLVTVAHEFDYRSPYLLARQDGGFVLTKDRSPVCTVKEVQMPQWYLKHTTSGRRMPSVFLHEGSRFLHQAYSGCDYHRRHLGCGFCSAGNVWSIGTPEEVSEVVRAAVKENGNYHVCLGGGTRLPLERNYDYFLECTSRIRQHSSSCVIWVEMIPPPPLRITNLVKEGVTSFGFNIEVWDDRRRREVCPGKGTLPKKDYLKRMEKAVSLLGPNRVGSCLIVGLEPLESTIQGAQTLASIGVQPCLLPFRPWDKSAYEESSPCVPETLTTVSGAAVQFMKASGINPHLNHGCLGCEGCTIDHDLYGLEHS